MSENSTSMNMKGKRKVILVTDGDRIAKKAVEIAAERIGGRCISRSAGNPTPMDGSSLISLIKQAEHDPVVVMVDDRGHSGIGKGEAAMIEIVKCPDIEVLGVIAVASNTEGVRGAKIDFSVTKDGNIVNKSVDKHGNIKEGSRITGDTVDILESIDIPIVAGIGDPGKMTGKDTCDKGAPIITKAMEEILKRSGCK